MSTAIGWVRLSPEAKLRAYRTRHHFLVLRHEVPRLAEMSTKKNTFLDTAFTSLKDFLEEGLPRKSPRDESFIGMNQCDRSARNPFLISGLRSKGFYVLSLPPEAQRIQ